jgi:hypothetical protein
MSEDRIVTTANPEKIVHVYSNVSCYSTTSITISDNNHNISLTIEEAIKVYNSLREVIKSSSEKALENKLT